MSSYVEIGYLFLFLRYFVNFRRLISRARFLHCNRILSSEQKTTSSIDWFSMFLFFARIARTWLFLGQTMAPANSKTSSGLLFTIVTFCTREPGDYNNVSLGCIGYFYLDTSQTVIHLNVSWNKSPGYTGRLESWYTELVKSTCHTYLPLFSQFSFISMAIVRDLAQ